MNSEYLSAKCSVFFETYTKKIIMALSLLLLISLIALGFVHNQKVAQRQYSDQLLSYLLIPANDQNNYSDLEELSNNKKAPLNIQNLAKLQLAKLSFLRNETSKSEQILMQLSKEKSADKFLRDLAVLTLANQFVLTNNLAALEKLLVESKGYKLTNFRDLANEQVVFLYWKNHRYAEAMERIEEILGDVETTAAVRLRMEQFKSIYQRQINQ